MASENRDDLLVRVASLYYENDYSQQQIAELLQISRSNISRLLKEAKEKGFVEIRVRKRVASAAELEREFRQHFGLEQALIFDSKGVDYTVRLSCAGQLAAQYLESILRPGGRLALSWGTGVSSAVSALAVRPALNVEVVQMIGSVGSVNSPIDGPELARQLAEKLGGSYYYLHAPLFVEGEQARDVFLKQPSIRNTLDRARQADVALLGVGTTEVGASSFLRAGHLSEAQLSKLRAAGVVGETAGQHFDIDGNAERFEINRNVIALDLLDVKQIPHTIAVACGLQKKQSIVGALRGGYINVLATDDITATAVLEEAQKRH